MDLYLYNTIKIVTGYLDKEKIMKIYNILDKQEYWRIVDIEQLAKEIENNC